MKQLSLSLYIHIPFCVSKCRYCDFYSIKYDKKLADNYIDALITEWNMISNAKQLSKYQIDTIYIGGGTPSLLTEEQWERLARNLFSQLNLSSSIEWSVECNPESFSNSLADLLYEIGVNRLTFGVQSLNDRELSVTGRIHGAETAINVLQNRCLRKFRSVNVDVMYGLPGQSIKTLEQTLSLLLLSDYVNHCSAYELTLNEDTPFGRHKNLIPFPDEDTVYEMSKIVRSILKNKGFIQYEISNFSKPKFRCLHNEAYWDHKSYIGLGAAAHSYLHPYRWSNPSDISLYLLSISQGRLPMTEQETIDTETLIREMLFLGFRRTDGINVDVFEKRTNRLFSDCVNMQKIETFLQNGWIKFQHPNYSITETGLLFADTMARELF